jgi:hypothetical protein
MREALGSNPPPKNKTQKKKKKKRNSFRAIKGKDSLRKQNPSDLPHFTCSSLSLQGRSLKSEFLFSKVIVEAKNIL